MAKKKNKEDNRLLLGSVRMPDVSNPTRDEVFKRRSAVSDDWEPSKELLDAIKSYEKFSPVVYKDGNGVETIGYGTTDKKIIAKYRGGKRMSKREAERLFNRHVDDVIAQMKDSIPNFSSMSNNQKDAMTSYVYNVGIGSITRKSPKLMEALEKKNWKEVAKQMDFGYNDEKNSGLRKRRDEEQALFTAYLDMGLEEPTGEELAAAHARMQQNALEDILSSRNELELQDPLRTDFNEAYRIAVKRKQPTFTWNGREFATDLKAEGGPVAPRDAIQPPANPTMDFMNLIGESIPYDAGTLPDINVIMDLSPEEYRDAMRKAAARRGRNYVYQAQSEAAPLMQGLAGAAAAASLASVGLFQPTMNFAADFMGMLENPLDPVNYLPYADVSKIARRTGNMGDFLSQIPNRSHVNDEYSEKARKFFSDILVPEYERNIESVKSGFSKNGKKLFDSRMKGGSELEFMEEARKLGISEEEASDIQRAARMQINVDLIKDEIKKPNAFEYNVKDVDREAMALYNRSDGNVYVSKLADAIGGDTKFSSLIHEFRHKMDSRGISRATMDEMLRKFALSSNEEDILESAYKSTGSTNEAGELAEKIATNAEFKARILRNTRDNTNLSAAPTLDEMFDTYNVTEEEFSGIVDNLNDNELLNLLSTTNDYGRDYASYVENIKNSESKKKTIDAIRKAVTTIPFTAYSAYQGFNLMNDRSTQEENIIQGGTDSDIEAANTIIYNNLREEMKSGGKFSDYISRVDGDNLIGKLSKTNYYGKKRANLLKLAKMGNEKAYNVLIDDLKEKLIQMDKKQSGGYVALRDAIQPPANPTMDFMNTIGDETPYYAGELPGVIITLKMNPDEYKSAMNKAAARRGRGYVYKGQDESKLLMQGLAGAAGAASLAGAGVLGRVVNTGMDAVDILLNPYDPTSYLSGFDYIKDAAAKANNLTRIKNAGKKADEIINAEEQGENMIKSDWGPKYNVVQTVKGDDEISKEVRKRFIEEVIPAYKNMTKQDMHAMTDLEKQVYEFIDENPKVPKNVDLISKLTGISPYAVDKAIRVRIGENITKLAEDYMKKPDTFEFNVSDNMGESVGGAYKQSDDKVYISKDVFEGDRENLINSLIHEFRHKFDLTDLRDDAVARKNSLDRIDAGDFTGILDLAYQPTYKGGSYGQGSVREKIATNAQLRDKIHSQYFYKLGINPKEGDFANTVDNMSDDELMDLLEDTNAYGRDYARSARENFDVETRANSIRYLLKNLPSSLPFGMDVDLIMNENKEDNQMKDGGSVSPITPYKLESQELPTVEHIMDVVSDANRESMDPIADSIIEMGYVPYIRNYFKEGGANSDGILNDYFKKWNEWMKRPRASRRKNSFENASELTKIQNYYRREVVPSLKNKMDQGGYTEDEIQELWGAFTPSGETPGADSLDALMATIQEMRYNAFNASLNDIRLDENVRSAIDGTIRSMPPEDFLIMLRNTNGFGADYAKRLDKMPDSDEKDEELYRMRDIMARATSYAPIGLGAAYYNNTSDEEVARQMGGLVQHWGDRDWGPDEPKKTPEQIKAELDERYKITPDMPEADRLMMLNLRSFQEGGELSNEYKVKYLYDLLLNEAGMSQNQALAVLGNLWGESHWSESASGDTNTSYGIQQWHGDRRKKLIEFAKNRSGNEEPTFWDQAHFLVKEYKEGQGFLDDNSPVKLDGYLSYSKNDFQNAESLRDAVVAWNQGFGRPHKNVMRTEDRYKGALKAAEMLGITVDENMPSFYGINGISEDPIVPAFDSFAATATKPSAAPATTSVAQNTGEDDEDIPAVPGIENMTQEERQKLWFETYGKQMVEDYIAEENRVKKEQEDARRLQYQQQAEEQAKRDAEATEQARRQAIIEQALDEAMLNIPGMAHGK